MSRSALGYPPSDSWLAAILATLSRDSLAISFPLFAEGSALGYLFRHDVWNHHRINREVEDVVGGGGSGIARHLQPDVRAGHGGEPEPAARGVLWRDDEQRPTHQAGRRHGVLGVEV